MNDKYKGEYAQEIPKEENDRRLSLIDLYGGRCPVCGINWLTKIEDELYVHGFDQGRHIFVCDKCGVVARRDVKYRLARPSVYWYKYGPPTHTEE